MISQNLTNLRKNKKISLEELADAIGVSRQAISKWESGETKPDLQNTIALADYYHITVDELISHKSDHQDGKYVFGMVSINDRGQIVLPKKARDVFHIQTGDNLMVLGDTKQGGIALVKVDSEVISTYMEGDKNVRNQNK